MPPTQLGPWVRLLLPSCAPRTSYIGVDLFVPQFPLCTWRQQQYHLDQDATYLHSVPGCPQNAPLLPRDKAWRFTLCLLCPGVPAIESAPERLSQTVQSWMGAQPGQLAGIRHGGQPGAAKHPPENQARHCSRHGRAPHGSGQAPQGCCNDEETQSLESAKNTSRYSWCLLHVSFEDLFVRILSSTGRSVHNIPPQLCTHQRREMAKQLSLPQKTLDRVCCAHSTCSGT